jgi:hypothetical protein
MAETFYVSLDIQGAIDAIEKRVVWGSISGERIDQYMSELPGKGHLVVLVYEKHYMLAGNRLTLTVTLDDFSGKTRVHWVSGGGGKLLRFDWGASEGFENVVQNALAQWRV